MVRRSECWVLHQGRLATRSTVAITRSHGAATTSGQFSDDLIFRALRVAPIPFVLNISYSPSPGIVWEQEEPFGAQFFRRRSNSANPPSGARYTQWQTAARLHTPCKTIRGATKDQPRSQALQSGNLKAMLPNRT